eukprot:PITA_27453
MEGGLQMCDLATQNLALGAKLLWNIVSGNLIWSKKVRWKKYFHGQRLRCLDQPPRTSKDGRSHQYQSLVTCLQFNTFWDISTWLEDATCLWNNWHLGEIPQWLEGEASILLDRLQGKSPLRASTKDKRGWGSRSGAYSTSEGYKSLMAFPNVPSDPAQWKFIWAFPSLPKVDFFCWTLARNNILTRDNLRRRGMEGPSMCTLCMSDDETTDHMFLKCPFAQEV